MCHLSYSHPERGHFAVSRRLLARALEAPYKALVTGQSEQGAATIIHVANKRVQNPVWSSSAFLCNRNKKHLLYRGISCHSQESGREI